MNIQLTELEFKALDHYAHCEMSPVNGAKPEALGDTGTYLWPDEAAAALGISEQALGGVLTSLATKGLATIAGCTSEDPEGQFNFTEAGFAAWQAKHRSKEHG